jgi:PAS domain S-box-containing protein
MPRKVARIMEEPLRILVIGGAPDKQLIDGALSTYISNFTIDRIEPGSDLNTRLISGVADVVIASLDPDQTDAGELVRQLKARLNGCPLILLADPEQRGAIRAAFSAGLDDYVIRSPEHLAALPETIRLVRARARRSLDASAETPAAGLGGKAALLQAVGTVAELLVRAPDWEQNAETILQTLCVGVNACSASLFRNHLDDYATQVTTEKYVFLNGYNRQPPDAGRLRRQVPVEWGSFSSLARQLIQRKPTRVDTTKLSADDKPLFEVWEDRSLLFLPIFIGGGWWGSLAFGDRDPSRRWQKDEIEGLESVVGLISAAIQHQQVQEALRSTEIHFRELVEHALVGIYQVDLNGKFVYVNPRLAEMIGRQPDDIIGHLTLFDLCLGDARDQLYAEFHRFLLNKDDAFHQTARFIGCEGTPMDVEIQGAKIMDGRRWLVIGTILDITERGLREREMEIIIHISTAMRAAQSKHEIIAIVLEQLLKLFDFTATAIALRDPGKGEITFDLARGLWAEWTGRRISPWEGITGRVISTGRLFISNNISLEVDPASVAEFAGVQSAACIPLTTSQQTVGCLWVGREAPFGDSEIRLLTAVAEVTANAINRAALNEQTDLRLQRMTALRAIDMAITASLDVRVTLNILIGQITTQLGVHAADVYLINPYSQMLEFVANRGFRLPPNPYSQNSAWQSFISRATIERQVINIPDLTRSGEPVAQTRWAGEDFIAYYAVPLIAKRQMKGVIELFHREPLSTDPEWMDFLQGVTAQAAIAIDNAELFDKLQRSNSELIMSYDATIEGWSHALELRDRETQGHTERVAELTVRLARAMQVPESELIHVRRGVLLHDIGKMAIPDGILRKQGPLSDQEWEIMRRHPQYAYDLLQPIQYLRPSLEIPYCHHERWDGAGYPRGLKGDQIPLVARIFSVVDVWDALHHDRHYRSAWTKERSMDYIRELSGAQFDPAVVDTFLRLIASEL